ncbi:LacI family DNA-binding transcriptional regulator [Paenarthrobacter sp. RAF54_2]|uniref:LacI family DNA-binding transcriptional regulator n=1 Tax=Paenarthrobacter sp. RAF54_2 TaxID=3233061 RepID=UPI003F94820D
MAQPVSESVTIIDVAQLAGVSKSTAARALAGYGSVSSKARQAVEAAADTLGYQANALARSMITGKTTTVGVVIPDISNPFFANAVRGISTAAREAGYDVLLSSTEGELGLERRAVSVLAGKRADGVIVAPVSNEDTAHLEELEAKGIAVTLLDRPAPKVTSASYVAVDHVGASALAVQHLLDLGHRNIGIVTEATALLPDQIHPEVAASLRPATARLLGYAMALRGAGIRYDPALVASSSYSRHSAGDAVRYLLKSKPSITALYCTDAEMSAGAFAALQDMGIDCPGHLSLVGFDDQDWATLVRPRLTVVEQPSYQLGRTAFKELTASMLTPYERRRNRILGGRLVVRESTARSRSA